jgi:DNA polymerase III delta' subunit
MGDDALIYAIGRLLMCQQPQGVKSCGQCRSCQLMQAETHPDYYTLEPEKGKSTLGIDAVRAVSEKLYERARLGGAKVVWLKDAAQLTEAAANALLKTLEEPPGNTWFLLSCREPGRLLATLRSRCRLHHLDAPQESWAVSWLQREVTTSQETALTALRLCGGAPAAALALLQPALWAQREQLCQAIGQAGENRDWLSLLANLITVLFGWMALVGVVRAEFLRTRNFDYIRAAQALGVGDRGIIFRHMLPNAMVATLTFLPFIMCSSITTLTSLDFLGFGLPLGSPSLGELLLQGKNNLQAPWLGITAFISVALLLSLLIFIGEAVRDAFDPNKAV